MCSLFALMVNTCYGYVATLKENRKRHTCSSFPGVMIVIVEDQDFESATWA